MPDVIDILAGVAAGSAVDTTRRRRPVARDHAQASWEALFQPRVPGGFSVKARCAVALFIAGLSRDEAAADFYRAGLVREGGGDWLDALNQAVTLGLTEGPYGRWAHHSALEAEGTDGLRWTVAAPALDARLSAALTAAHRLIFRPRESSQADLEALLDAGWSETDIVSLSQLVAFLSFQLRVAHGLRVLGEVLE